LAGRQFLLIRIRQRLIALITDISHKNFVVPHKTIVSPDSQYSMKTPRFPGAEKGGNHRCFRPFEEVN
jgi:hypothetical protein